MTDSKTLLETMEKMEVRAMVSGKSLEANTTYKTLVEKLKETKNDEQNFEALDDLLESTSSRWDNQMRKDKRVKIKMAILGGTIGAAVGSGEVAGWLKPVFDEMKEGVSTAVDFWREKLGFSVEASGASVPKVTIPQESVPNHDAMPSEESVPMDLTEVTPASSALAIEATDIAQEVAKQQPSELHIAPLGVGESGSDIVSFADGTKVEIGVGTELEATFGKEAMALATQKRGDGLTQVFERQLLGRANEFGYNKAEHGPVTKWAKALATTIAKDHGLLSKDSEMRLKFDAKNPAHILLERNGGSFNVHADERLKMEKFEHPKSLAFKGDSDARGWKAKVTYDANGVPQEVKIPTRGDIGADGKIDRKQVVLDKLRELGYGKTSAAKSLMESLHEDSKDLRELRHTVEAPTPVLSPEAVREPKLEVPKAQVIPMPEPEPPKISGESLPPLSAETAQVVSEPVLPESVLPEPNATLVSRDIGDLRQGLAKELNSDQTRRYFSELSDEQVRRLAERVKLERHLTLDQMVRGQTWIKRGVTKESLLKYLKLTHGEGLGTTLELKNGSTMKAALDYDGRRAAHFALKEMGITPGSGEATASISQPSIPEKTPTPHLETKIEKPIVLNSAVAGTFQYDASGNPTGFLAKDTFVNPPSLEKKYFKEGWFNEFMTKFKGNPHAERIKLQTSLRDLLGKDAALAQLVKEGNGNSAEAKFLKKSTEFFIKQTKAKYGTIFKEQTSSLCLPSACQGIGECHFIRKFE